MRKLVVAKICLLSLSLSEEREHGQKKSVIESWRYTEGIVDLFKPQKFDTCREQTLLLPIFGMICRR